MYDKLVVFLCHPDQENKLVKILDNTKCYYKIITNLYIPNDTILIVKDEQLKSLLLGKEDEITFKPFEYSSELIDDGEYSDNFIAHIDW